ncbi:uncharacterized protein FIBRA_05936 [Fibroporia radiculosa]|uniref:Glutaredoxin domain-containing protein n=1 Tax=Fibroporia radiculosa TaxID=599839 RepID=J4H3T2_9APHY|nr:uncharacterized protein FIBRA_05936 [Fibroporia radiculosa]CCM03789.1 predicted protein [Fibroporia radiculosa]
MLLPRLYRSFSSGLASLFSSSPPDPVSIPTSISSTAAPSSSKPSVHQRKLMAAKDLVETAVSDSTITIFSKTWCPYCKRAKQLLTTKFPNVPTKILELDELDEGSEIQSYLAEKTGQGTVPSIFINQKHVGGCDNVVGLDSRGELASLVAA